MTDFILYAVWDLDLVDKLDGTQDPRDALASWTSDIGEAIEAIEDTPRHEILVHNLGDWQQFPDKGALSYRPNAGGDFYEIVP